jgi:hypothetical protein
MAPSLTLASADVEAFMPSGRTLEWNRCGRRARGLSFARRVDVPFEASVARLNEWMAAHAGAVDIGRSRLISRLPGSDDDRLRIEVSLGRGSTGRAVPMELELIRWSPRLGTAIELQPRRDVRPSARYFDAGHALLDAVAAIIASDLDAA